MNEQPTQGMQTESMGRLADEIRMDTARRCAEIADKHVPFEVPGVKPGVKIDGRLIAAAIRREFGLKEGE